MSLVRLQTPRLPSALRQPRCVKLGPTGWHRVLHVAGTGRKDELSAIARAPGDGIAARTDDGKEQPVSTIGELTDISVPDLIEIFARRGHTGRLTVKTGNEEVRLLFDGGRLVSITSNDLSLRLGRMLIRQGLLSPPQLLEALQRQAEARNGLPLGAILIERGWVTQSDLRHCIEEQSIEIIARILDDQPGMFVWEAGISIPTQTEALPLDPGILLRAARERTAALQMLRKQLPFPGEPLFVARTVPDEPLSEAERTVISALHGGARTFAELRTHLALDELSLGMAVLSLRDRGVIVPLRGQPAPMVHAQPRH
ncbi:MAG: hypothetical protein C4346_07365 [Chloroflexota bacterium]